MKVKYFFLFIVLNTIIAPIFGQYRNDTINYYDDTHNKFIITNWTFFKKYATLNSIKETLIGENFPNSYLGSICRIRTFTITLLNTEEFPVSKDLGYLQIYEKYLDTCERRTFIKIFRILIRNKIIEDLSYYTTEI